MTETLNDKEALGLRLTIGLGFGLVLATIAKTFSDHATPLPQWASVTVPTLYLGSFVIWAAAGSMRKMGLIVWGVIVLALIAAIFAWRYGVFARDQRWFSPETALLVPILFVLHELISGAEGAKRLIAPYPAYFDQAWTHGVQLALALLFTGLMWIILTIGATLLSFIGFKWFGDWTRDAWFAIPVTGLALGAAVHLGDVQSKILTQIRGVILGVLAWLLPIMTVIAGLFAVSLCFSGLKPLWATKAAGITLLSASTILVLLINAAFQSGEADKAPHMILQWADKIASVLLLGFAGLAAYSLWLRVGQYGWTPQRIMASLGAIIAMLYGIGYALHVVLPGVKLQAVNIVIAYIFCGLGLGLQTPWGNPTKISIDNQVARLEANKVKPDDFDWNLLGQASGKFGDVALKKLSASKVVAIADHARQEIEDNKPLSAQDNAKRAKADLRQLTVVYPKGAALPASFLNIGPTKLSDAFDCLKYADQMGKCQAAIIDVNGDHHNEVLVLSNQNVWVFSEDKDGWKLKQSFWIDDKDKAAFFAGQISVAPVTHYEIKIGASTNQVTATSDLVTEMNSVTNDDVKLSRQAGIVTKK